MIFNESIYNKDWPIKKLSQLGDFSRGVSKHRPRDDARLFIDGDIPFLQTGEVKSARLYVDSYSAKYNDFGLSQSKLWHKGTLCITIAANIAESAILSRDMCFPDSIVGFVPNDNETTSEYMYYIFEYIKSQIQSRTNGSIQDNINIDYLKDLEFRISPNQEKIKKVLSDIDNKILLNQAIIGKLESMAKTLYDYWFVQFDFPDANGRPYKTSGGKMEWNETLSREIPAGWGITTLEKYFEIGNGKDHSQLENGIYPVYGSGGLMRRVNKFLFNEESVLIPRKGTLNNVMHVCGAFWTVDTMYYTKMKRVNTANYVYQTVNLFNFEKLNTGSALPSMTASIIYSLKVPDAPASLIDKYENYASEFFTKIQLLEEENRKLCSLRDFLLPMLMNGQVTFRQ